MESPIHYFEIDVIESTGFLGKAGFPILFCRVVGIIPEANIVILKYHKPEKKWLEYKVEISQDESLEILKRLKKIGIPDRLPKVKGLQATAPFWIDLSLKIKFDDKRFYLDLWTERAIYGQDAENFQELFQYLFNLVGYSGDSSLTAITLPYFS